LVSIRNALDPGEYMAFGAADNFDAQTPAL